MRKQNCIAAIWLYHKIFSLMMLNCSLESGQQVGWASCKSSKDQKHKQSVKWRSNENQISWIPTISRTLQFMGGLKHCWSPKNRELFKLEGTSDNNFEQPPAHAGPPRANFPGLCPEFPRRLVNLSGQPVPVLGHSHRVKVFPDVQVELPLF